MYSNFIYPNVRNQMHIRMNNTTHWDINYVRVSLVRSAKSKHSSEKIEVKKEEVTSEVF